MFTFATMKSVKEYISNFVLIIYIIGVSHTFIEHSNYDVNCATQEKECCTTDQDNHKHFNYKNHTNLDFYDFVACLLGHLNHYEVVDNKDITAEKIILKAPKEIRTLVAFCLLWIVPTEIIEENTYFVDQNTFKNPLTPLSLSAKRGPPSIV